jgi:hypothetical protein
MASKHKVSNLGIAVILLLYSLLNWSFFLNTTAIAQQSRCVASDISNKINQLPKNPSLVDTIAICGSSAVPILTRHLNSLFSRKPDRFEENEYLGLLIITTLGEMRTEASSSTRDLARLLSDKSLVKSEDLDKAILYALGQINDSPYRALAVLASDSSENMDLRISAFWILRSERLGSNTLKQVRESITTSLLRVVEMGSYTQIFDATSEIESLYNSDLDQNYKQVIISALTKIISETRLFDPTMTEESRIWTQRRAVKLLWNFDKNLAQKIENELSLPKTLGSLPFPVITHREKTVKRLQSAPPAICRYALLQNIFAWKCK